MRSGFLEAGRELDVALRTWIEGHRLAPDDRLAARSVRPNDERPPRDRVVQIAHRDSGVEPFAAGHRLRCVDARDDHASRSAGEELGLCGREVLGADEMGSPLPPDRQAVDGLERDDHEVVEGPLGLEDADDRHAADAGRDAPPEEYRVTPIDVERVG